MKYLFIALLFTGIQACGQKKDSTGTSTSIMGGTLWLTRDGVPPQGLYLSYDGSSEIRGDTMQIIRLLVDEIKRRDSIQSVMYDTIAASVDFTNLISSYWKKPDNACWNKYLSLLHKNGWITIKGGAQSCK